MNNCETCSFLRQMGIANLCSKHTDELLAIGKGLARAKKAAPLNTTDITKGA